MKSSLSTILVFPKTLHEESKQKDTHYYTLNYTIVVSYLVNYSIELH